MFQSQISLTHAMGEGALDLNIVNPRMSPRPYLKTIFSKVDHHHVVQSTEEMDSHSVMDMTQTPELVILEIVPQVPVLQ